ncbi:PadR family transcriptional regulator [Eubacterium barkeri]|uniref:Transcriptional regulator PadR-like family protein n=1 Tax=Eubacterium barkeri TaxID=1528 RepID=A0A1H3DQV5_EUBBA|nr:PadR family transcriptional regulator [Eubacterium barkeri]SDX68912.1 Transcriptional regulator PadR-like family protein [Eubacterium barkeri]
MMIQQCKSCQGKNLERFIQPIILSILKQESEINGYAIIKKIGEYAIFEGQSPDPTGVYRYLKQMAERGLIESSDAGRERRYRITPEGRHCLGNWRETLEEYQNRIQELCEELAQV